MSKPILYTGAWCLGLTLIWAFAVTVHRVEALKDSFVHGVGIGLGVGVVLLVARMLGEFVQGIIERDEPDPEEPEE